MADKTKKCILVGYSHEQKGKYKCYNSQTKEIFVFNELAPWYLPPASSILMHSEPHSNYEASVDGSFEEEIHTQEESLISFRLSWPIEELSQND